MKLFGRIMLGLLIVAALAFFAFLICADMMIRGLPH